MEPRRRALAMVGIFVVLLAFHSWLLYRMVTAANSLLASLLVVAIALFAWRIHHYANRYRGAAEGRPVRGPEVELRQIRVMAPVLAGLLALHAWLISLMVSGPPTLEKTAFLALLVLAVVVFVTRLGFYARRYAKLRGRP